MSDITQKKGGYDNFTVGRILCKADDLEATVKDFEKKGFEVSGEGPKRFSYQSRYIYFSQGPFIELVEFPQGFGFSLKMFGMGLVMSSLANRMKSWQKAPEGWLSLGLERIGSELLEEETLLRESGMQTTSGSYGSSKETTTTGRVIEERTTSYLYSDDPSMPFFEAFTKKAVYRPDSCIHPNGVTGISKVVLGTSQKQIDLLRTLCQDPRLELVVGDGISEIKFSKE